MKSCFITIYLSFLVCSLVLAQEQVELTPFNSDSLLQKQNEKVILKSTTGIEVECIILEVSKETVRILKPNNTTAIINKRLIESINGTPLKEFYKTTNTVNKLSTIDIKKAPFAKSIGSSGGFLAAGGGFILLGAGLTVLSTNSSSVADSKALLYAGSGIAVLGTVFIMIGGFKLIKASDEFSKIEFGTARRKILRYDFGGTHASVSLQF
jgi:hypothetical protein